MIAALHCPECHLMYAPREAGENGACPDCGYTDKTKEAKMGGQQKGDMPPVVIQLAKRHASKWRDRNDDYWMRRLNQEVSELQLVLDDQHDDPAELELAEIASICINWLKKKQAPDRKERAFKAESKSD